MCDQQYQYVYCLLLLPTNEFRSWIDPSSNPTPDQAPSNRTSEAQLDVDDEGANPDDTADAAADDDVDVVVFYARPGKTVCERITPQITGTAMFLNATTKTPSWVGGSTQKEQQYRLRLEERDRFMTTCVSRNWKHWF
jgi:hypothetical protein